MRIKNVEMIQNLNIFYQIQNDIKFQFIKKYLNKNENKLSKNSYSINHLYFNPVFLFINYNGFFKNNTTYDYTYTFDRNDININKQSMGNDIYI